MTFLPLAILGTSLIPGAVMFFLRERQVKTRTALNLAGATAKVALVVVLVPPVVAGQRIELRAPFVPGVDFVLRVEPFALFFLGLSAFLWLLTTIFAIGYLRDDANRSRFFAFFSLAVASTSGVALAGNWITFVFFYELLTLATYPLVAHDQTKAAFAGARTYLRYTVTGGTVLLLGVVWLTYVAGPVEFREAGSPGVAALAERQPAVAAAIFALIFVGLGVKAAVVPLHGWLPRAMVAPPPVSALLHAVAVVKAGVFGIVLLIDDTFGVYVAEDLGVLTPVLILGCVTIIYGSVQALRQDNLKKRLAYSTVSQVSYVVIGAAMVSVIATTGGVVHIVNQGLMKITMFFVAGLLAKTIGVTKISELNGVGRCMPLTCAAFTIAALGMIGIPPVAGFVSKWYLGLGALDAGDGWVLAILIASSVLNAAYFLPAVYRMWWLAPDPDVGWEVQRRHWAEAPMMLLAPTVVTAGSALAVGVFAGLAYSPLELARFIVEGTYRQ